MSMKANNIAEWVSNPIEQESADSDWIEHQSSISSVIGGVSKLTGTNPSQLVCWDDEVSDGSKFSIRQGGALYEGIASVSSSREVEVDRYYGFNKAKYVNSTNSNSPIGSGPLDVLHGIDFKPDGMMVFALSSRTYFSGYQQTDYRITRHQLGTAWDITTITSESYILFRDDTVSFNSRNIAISNDGLNIYVPGFAQFTLGVAWDITTCPTTATNNYDVNNDVSVGGLDVHITPDGTKIFQCGLDTIAEWDMLTPFDITSLSFVKEVSGIGGRSFDFSDDGTICYVAYASAGSGDITQYTLSTPWDLSTRTVTATADVGVEPDLNGLYVNDQEKKFYVVGGTLEAHQYSYLIDTVIYRQENTIPLTAFGLSTNPEYVFTQVPEMKVCTETSPERCISRDTPMYVNSLGTNQIQVVHSDNLNQILEPDDLVVVDEGDVAITSVVDTGTTTLAPTKTSDTFTPTDGIGTFCFSNDGTKIYTSTSAKILQYELSVAWDITTASTTYSSSTDLGLGYSLSWIVFSDDGKYMYGSDSNNNKIRQYGLPVAWDITDAYEIQTMDVISHSGFSYNNPRGIAFSKYGDRFYISANSVVMYEYVLDTPWDISTRTYRTYNQNGVYQFVFSDDGTKLISSSGNEWVLSNPWDISSATQRTSTGLSLVSIDINNDGTIVYVWSTGGVIESYTLSRPYSLGGEKIWNVNLPLSGIPTFAHIKDRSVLLPYTRNLVAGDVYQVGVSVSTNGSFNHTFDSQSFVSNPSRAIQMAVSAGAGTTVSTLTANLWKAGTPTA